MTIDYNHMKDEATRTGISVFTLIKRKIGYSKNAGKGMCKNCEFVAIPEFEGKQRMQCTLVGIGYDDTADVKPTWSCRKGYELREEQLKVIIDFLNNLEKE